MQIFREFDSLRELEIEFKENLRKARSFVPGEWGVGERDLCDFVLVHPVSGEWYPILVEVVWVSEKGVGVELRNMGEEQFETLEEFIFCFDEPLKLIPSSSPPAGRERFELASPTPAIRIPIPEHVLTESGRKNELDWDALSPPTERVIRRNSEEEPPKTEEEPPLTLRDGPRTEPQVPSPEPRPSEPPPSEIPRSEPPRSSGRPPPRNVQERVRQLNIRERDAMARQGTLTERVALERAYGPVVWDALLSNAALTGPEVARIAKNGNASIPLLQQIVANPGWLAKAEVRRALLTNPKLPAPQIERVLRALPASEVRQLAKQTAYGPKVRDIARRLFPKT